MAFTIIVVKPLSYSDVYLIVFFLLLVSNALLHYLHVHLLSLLILVVVILIWSFNYSILLQLYFITCTDDYFDTFIALRFNHFVIFKLLLPATFHHFITFSFFRQRWHFWLLDKTEENNFAFLFLSSNYHCPLWNHRLLGHLSNQ